MSSPTATSTDKVAPALAAQRPAVIGGADVAGEVSGKGRKAGKGKGKAKAVDPVDEGNNEDDTSDEMINVKEETIQIGVDSLDIAAHRAIFSLNRINLRKPPLDLTFGIWNSRPLVPARAKELLNTMKSQEIRPFRLQNMIPIIISRSDVDPACLNMNIQTVSTSPMIQLTAAGMKKANLQVAGGQHRYKAVKIATDEATTLIAKLKDMIVAEEARELKTEDAKEKRKVRVQEMRQSIEEKERLIDGISIWGVILYDEEKMIAHGQELAYHISRNEEIKHFPEDEREGLVMYVKALKSKMRPEADKDDLKEWLRRLAQDAKKSVLGQIMNHAESHRYLLTLEEFEPHFDYLDVYSISWVKGNLHNIGGGVLVTIVEYLANIWRSLLSPMRYFEMQDNAKWAAYKAELAQPVDTRQEDILRAGIVGWASLVDSTMVAKRRPNYSLLNASFMKGMVEAAAEQDVLELLVGTNAGAWEGYCLEVESLFATHIYTKPFEDEDERQVRDLFQRKWELVKMNHFENHFQRPLLMLTPNVVAGLGYLMGRIPNSQAEFWRWIDPLGQYFCFNLKNANEAKDVSSWALRTIRSNVEGLFINGDDTARDLAHFVINNVDAFIQFEADIKNFPIPPRPMLHSEQTPAALEKRFPKIKESVDALVKTMKANKGKGQSTGNWILDRRSHYDWHNPVFKNPARDYVRFAQAAYMEQNLTDEYRKKLLRSSASARFLRYKVEQLLSSHCKPRNVLVPGSSLVTSNVKAYVFPDGLKVEEQAKPVVDVEVLVSKQDIDQKTMKARKLLESYIKKIENSPLVVARPGSTLLAPFVADKIRELEEVMLMNIYILNAMEQEEDVTLVDPLSKEWDAIDVDDLEFPHKPIWTKDSKEAKATAQARKEAAAAAKETAAQNLTRHKGKDDGVRGSKDVDSRPVSGGETSKVKAKVKPRAKVGVIRRSRSVEGRIDMGGDGDRQGGETGNDRQSLVIEPRVGAVEATNPSTTFEPAQLRQSTKDEPRASDEQGANQQSTHIDTPSSQDESSEDGSNITSPPLSPKPSTERFPGKGKAKGVDPGDGDFLSDPTQPMTPPPQEPIISSSLAAAITRKYDLALPTSTAPSTSGASAHPNPLKRNIPHAGRSSEHRPPTTRGQKAQLREGDASEEEGPLRRRQFKGKRR